MTLPQYSCIDAIKAFRAAQLYAVSERPMSGPDYGDAPQRAVEALRFFLPQLGADSGGRVFAFEDLDGLRATKAYYDHLTKGDPAGQASWVVVHGNVLLQINGALPRDEAERYRDALRRLGPAGPSPARVQRDASLRRWTLRLSGPALALWCLVGVLAVRSGLRTEKYDRIVAAWVLLAPAGALVASLVLRRRGDAARSGGRTAAGIATAVATVAALTVATLAVAPCDRRGPNVVLRACNLAGEDLGGVNLTGADLAAADLTGTRLVGARLDRANLAGARLERADLDHASLPGAVLDGAKLGQARLSSANLSGAALTGADLAGAHLGGADLGGAVLVEANLTGSDLAKANLKGADLSRSTLSGASLVSTIFTAANLDHAKLGSPDLSGLDLNSARLDGVDLSKLRLAKAQLRSASLPGVNLTEADLAEADLSGANLTGANLSGARLAGALLAGAKLSGVNAERANLTGASLSTAVLTKGRFVGADLSHADLRKAQSSGADFDSAALPGANLSEANLADANLTGARLSGANLSKVQAAGATFNRAVLDGGVNLSEAKLGKAKLVGAQIVDANLAKADLTEAAMEGVTLRNVAMDEVSLTNVADLDNRALADAFLVTEARLARVVKDRAIKFEPRDQIVSRVGPACNGTAVAGAGRYVANGEFHPVVALNGEGKTTDVASLHNSVRDARWEPSGLRFAELVACVDGETTSSVEVCPYTVISTGERRFITRLQVSRRVRLVASASGAVVSQRTFTGGVPNLCPETTNTGQTTIRGSAPTVDEMRGWLGEFVRL